jgi:hypothetical protein
MRSNDLTPEQAHAIHERLRPIVAYLLKLEERMEERDFPRDDQLYRMVKQAHDAVHALFLETHELGCKGVGRGDQRERFRRQPQASRPPTATRSTTAYPRFGRTVAITGGDQRTLFRLAPTWVTIVRLCNVSPWVCMISMLPMN